jgi:hypothetical protein
VRTTALAVPVVGLFLALAIGHGTAAAHHSAVAVTLGSFACYDGLFGEFTTRKVKLSDRFGTRSAIVGRPVRFCSAARVNGGTSPDPYAHLTCHPIRAPKPTPRSVTTSTRLGSLSMTIVKPLTLCAPSSTVSGGTLTPPPTSLDYVTCYSTTLGGSFSARSVTLIDKFSTSPSRDVVTSPTSLCAPTSVNTARRRGSRLLICYELRPRATSRSVAGRSPFGFFKASLEARKQVCMPTVD